MCLQFLVEEGGDIGQFDIARQMRFADCTQQDERQRACIHLLVVQHVIGQSAPVALEISAGSPAVSTARVTRRASSSESAPRRAE